jgi:hypothetical protein
MYIWAAEQQTKQKWWEIEPRSKQQIMRAKYEKGENNLRGL